MKRLFVIVLVTLAGLTQIAQGQVRGIPPSVTSLAPGRQFLPGPSVTSLGPFGYSNGPTLLGNPRTFRHQRFAGGRRGLRSGAGAIYVPYAVPVYPMLDAGPDAMADPNAADASGMYQPDPNYAGPYGLTPPSQLRANSRYSGMPAQVAPSAAKAVSDAPQSQSKPVQSQPSTVLVFKDGHKVEVTNYVISGETLFNLGDTGPRKIAVADLDLAATATENDNHGVEFRLPQ